jgi:gamma-glutamyltranspeptidase/glutathione hydrolase
MGFIYNNGMHNFDPIPGRTNSIAPGKLRRSPHTPTIIFEGEQPRLALGAPGGQAIPAGCLQSACNVLHFDMSATEAVSAPRIHAEEWTAWCEARIRMETCEALKKAGYTVERQPWSYSPLFSWVQLVNLLPDGSLQAGSDPRSMGGGYFMTRS